MSASVAESPSALKSTESQVGQQVPARQAKKAWMSASVAGEPSWSKSGEPQAQERSREALGSQGSRMVSRAPSKVGVMSAVLARAGISSKTEPFQRKKASWYGVWTVPDRYRD